MDTSKDPQGSKIKILILILTIGAGYVYWYVGEHLRHRSPLCAQELARLSGYIDDFREINGGKSPETLLVVLEEKPRSCPLNQNAEYHYQRTSDDEDFRLYCSEAAFRSRLFPWIRYAEYSSKGLVYRTI